MGILERAYRVFKANIQYHLFKGSGTHSGPEEEPFAHERGSADQQNHHGDHAQPPPNQDPKIAQYYANLEIPYGSDLKTVQSAWKKLMRQYHPDMHSKDADKRELAKELAQQLNHARSELEKHLKGR